MLQRYVGGAGMFGSLANILSKAKDIYNQTKPAVSAIKGMLPDTGFMGKLKSGMSSVGYGTGAGTGAGMDGMGTGAGTGAGTGGRRRGLSARLM
jgi:hypothetical protein